MALATFFKNTFSTKVFSSGTNLRFTVLMVLLLILSGAAIWATLSTAENQRLLQDSHAIQKQRGIIAAKTLQERMAQAQASAVSFAHISQSLYLSPEQLTQTIPALLNDNSQPRLIVGGGVWSAPYAFDPTKERLAYFWGQQADEGMVKFDQYNDPNEPSYVDEPWFKPLANMPDGSTHWSDAYRDPYTKQTMVTVSSPIWDKDRFLGVVTIDMAMDGINNLVRRISEQQPGYLFLADRNHRVLAHPHLDDYIEQMPDRFPSLQELVEEEPNLAPILTLSIQAANSNSEIFQMPIAKDPVLGIPVNLKVFNIGESGWKLFLVSPTISGSEGYQSSWAVALMVGFVLCFVFFLIHLYVRQSLIAPLTDLADASEQKQTNLLKALANCRQPDMARIASSMLNLNATLRSSQSNLEASNLALAKQQASQSTIDARNNGAQGYFMEFMNSSSALMTIRDLQGRFITANDRYCSATQRTLHHLVGKTIAEVFPESIAEKALIRWQQVIETNKNVYFEDSYIIEQTQGFYVSKLFPIFDQDGERIAIGYIGLDCSKLKNQISNLDEQLQQVKLELQQTQQQQHQSIELIDSQRTAQTQLKQHLDQVKLSETFTEQQDQRIIQLLTNYTAILKQQLNSLYTAAIPDHVTDSDANWQQLDSVEYLMSQSNHLHLLFQALSQPLAHKQINSYLHHYIEIFNQSNHLNNVAIELRCDDAISSDFSPLHWLRMLHCLLQNATQHGFNPISENAKIIVEIQQSAQQTCLLVTDNGFGMPAKELSQLNEMDHSQNVTSLILLRAWLARHHGELMINSELNKGCQVQACISRNLSSEE
ncbi:cache domain-containing protein [Paraferrimonas haliotis]|uniref:cache domain-containing protein n=1 Tax=Paraferrimonas haliotis TaxID=2013866 RepID=UPI000BA9C65B|nr:cache domain-containing protein [Paraferrimonas haliotis]